MAYLIGLYLVAEGGVSRTRKLGGSARTRIAAWFGSVRARLDLLAEWIGDHWPRRNRDDDEAGPLLNEDELTAWIADITDPNLPKFKEQEPRDTPDERPERSSDLAPGPREESARGIAWADGPTRSLPVWELRAAQPTALVTRPRIPRDEIRTHYDNHGFLPSYLGPLYTPNYKPKHAAREDDHSGQTADARPTRDAPAPVGEVNARWAASRTRTRTTARRGRPAGNRTRQFVRRGEPVHGTADRPGRRSYDHVPA